MRHITALRRPATARSQFERRSHEDIRHNHRRGIWPARRRSHLALQPGRAGLVEGSLVRGQHRYRGSVLPVGVALVQAPAARMSATLQNAGSAGSPVVDQRRD